VHSVFPDAPRIGCTGGATFTGSGGAHGGVAVTALGGDLLRVRTGLGEGHADDAAAAVRAATATFGRQQDDDLDPRLHGRTLLVLADGRAGGRELAAALIAATGTHYQLLGGFAAGDRRTGRAAVVCGDRVATSAFAVAEILTPEPFRIAAGHGWRPAGPSMRVTRARGDAVVELDGRPAGVVFHEQAGRQLDGQNGALPPLLLGVRVGEGRDLRVPLRQRPDGALLCSGEVDEGAVVQWMLPDRAAAIAAGSATVQQALAGADQRQIAGALVLECSSTPSLLGPSFADHVERTIAAVAPRAIAGCATAGQLLCVDGCVRAPLEATTLVCLLPA
jgi:hypothetical protein